MGSDRNRQRNVTREPRLGWLGWLPFALLALLLLAGAVALVTQRISAERNSAAMTRENERLGLPADYPAGLLPLFPRVKVVEAKREDAKSDKGEPMNKWYVHATTSEPPKKLHDYYTRWAEKRDMSQTMGIQIPTGYGVNYADAEVAVEFVMETRPPGKLTHLEITLYRLKR
jgi:hypothetical protein